ncbi:hypothetical protein QZH41_013912, partial [Actinostola sp. cb2023]
MSKKGMAKRKFSKSDDPEETDSDQGRKTEENITEQFAKEDSEVKIAKKRVKDAVQNIDNELIQEGQALNIEEARTASRKKSSGQDEAREDTAAAVREESFTRTKKKGKARKGKKAVKVLEDSETSEAKESELKKKGKAKRKAPSKSVDNAPAESESTSKRGENITEQIAKEYPEKELKEKDTVKNIDNKLIQEVQETEKNSTKEAKNDLDTTKVKDEQDEKKDSKKETTSDEDVQDINGNAREKDSNGKDKIRDGETEELRRRPTLSELKAASMEAADPLADAEDQNFDSVKEVQDEQKIDVKDESLKEESSSDIMKQESEVVIDVERKISKDRLTSIKVIPNDQVDAIAVPLPEEPEELRIKYLKSLDAPPKKGAIEEDEEWPQSEEEEDYEPPNDELPDIDEMMGTLDGGESELETTSPPPPVIQPEDKVSQQGKIDELKLGLAEEKINSYLDDFENRMEEEILMIGQISLEEVQEEERRLRDEHISYQQQEAKTQRERIQDIMAREERAKKYVMGKLKEKRKAILRREEHLMQQDRLIQNRIHRAFRRAENQLLKALKARKGEVKTMYGDLILADGQYGGSKGRRWKVDWNRTPQPIQIKLKCLRGVKDKLPCGRFVLMVSLYDRLGGHVLKWSKLKGQQWGGATLPLNHDGEFFNIEIKIDQSVFTVCPARPDVRPGMALVFELFILRGSVTATDRVVGWGCFPICDGEFNIVEGRYKAPFLRGDMDPGIDKHEKIEELMAEDLENWLCNLYFEIVRLPRYMAGQKEYEVELQFTSGLVGYPSRTNTGDEFIDGEEPVYGSRVDLKSLNSPSSSRRPSRISMLGGSSFLGSTMDLKGEGKDQLQGSAVDLQVEVPDISTMPKRKLSLAVPDASSLRRSSIVSQSRRMSAVSTTRRMSRPMTVHMSRKAAEADASSDGSGTDYSDDEVLMLKKNDGFKPVKGQPGMFYKKHHNNPVDVYAKKMFTMLPKTALLTRRKKKKKLTHTEELEQHSFSVKQPFSNKGHIHHRGREKMQYVGRQLMAELGLSQWRSREFWAMMLMIAFTWFLRLFTHYGGQWLYLTALRIPINKFEFLPYSVNLNYQSTLLHTEEVIALVVLGPFSNIMVLCIMIIAAWAIQRLFGFFPNIFSRFIMAFGINTLLDPIWIVIVDASLSRFENLGGDEPIGDAFKLYWHFDRYEKNGAVGIVLAIFLYIVTLFTCSTILYMYFLRLHNNGRLMDVYHRLHADEDDFFTPYDLEISNEELNFVGKKAEQWRGEEGERRKTAVYDYIWEEEQVDESEMYDAKQKKTGHREITTHVSIHTLHLDGLRELYRHFLRLPDGAIVEV